MLAHLDAVEARSPRSRWSIAPTATSRSRGRKTYGKGRVFYSTLGHVVESWDDPVLQQMYFNAHEVGARPDARRRDATPESHADTMKRIILAGAIAVACSSASRPRRQKDWVYYGQDQGATRFSTLAQITTANVANLKRAWTFHTGDKSGFFESTPLVIDSVMYFAAGQRRSSRSTPSPASRSGKCRRRRTTRRGVSYWPGDAKTPPRIIASAGHRADGARREDRQARSRTSATTGSVELEDSMNSPAAIYKDLAIVQGNKPWIRALERAHRQAGVDVQPECAARRDRARHLGRRRAGRPPAAPTSGDCSRSTRRAAWSSCRCRCRATTTTTAATITATTCTAPASSRVDAATGKLQLVPAARAPRHLGLRPRRRADAGRRREGRQDDSGRRADHQDGAAVRLQSHDRRADVRHRRASGAADDGAGREDVADAAVPGEAAAARAQFDEEGGAARRSRRSTRRTARGCGRSTTCRTRCPYKPWNDKQDIVAVPGRGRRRQLARRDVQPAARPDDHQRDERGAVGPPRGARRARRGGGTPAEAAAAARHAARRRGTRRASAAPAADVAQGDARRAAASGIRRRCTRARRRRGASWSRSARTPATSRGACRSASSTSSTPRASRPARPSLGGAITTAGNLVFIGATIDSRFRAFDARNGKELWSDKLEAPGALDSVDLHGPRRQAVRRHCRGRRRLPAESDLRYRRRLHAEVVACWSERVDSTGFTSDVALARCSIAGGAAVQPRWRVGAAAAGRGGGARRRGRARRVLAWADTRNGIAQHDSVSHALAVIERLGYESGAYDTYIRTDSNIIAKQPLMTTGAAGERRSEPGQRRRDLLPRPSRGPLDDAAEGRAAGVRHGRRQGLRRRAHGADGVRVVAGVRRAARRALRRPSVGHAPRHGHQRGSGVPGDEAFPATFPFTDEFYQPKDVLARQDARAAAARRVEDAAEPGAASHRRRLSAGVGEDVRQGTRLLLVARPRRRDVGQPRRRSRCTSKRSSGRSA